MRTEPPWGSRRSTLGRSDPRPWGRRNTHALADSRPWSRRRKLVLLVLLSVPLWASACGETSTEPRPEAEINVLFIGNSMGYWNGLPGLFQTLGDSVGFHTAWGAVTGGGFSLEDHWADGQALTEIRRGVYDVVVLQQGPAEFPADGSHLTEWVGRFADEIRSVGALPALYMVWAPADRFGDFDGVVLAHQEAAVAADAFLLPAGEVWQAVFERDASVPLYEADLIHPTLTGNYVTAIVMLSRLSGVPAQAFPRTLRTPGFPPTTIQLEVEAARLIREAVSEVVGRYPEAAPLAASLGG